MQSHIYVSNRPGDRVRDHGRRTGGARRTADRRLAELGADQERLEGELAAAREAADVSNIATIRSQLEATGEAIAALAAQGQRRRAPVSGRCGVSRRVDDRQVLTADLLGRAR